MNRVFSGLPGRVCREISVAGVLGDRVRTASGSDRIKTQLSRTTNVFKCIAWSGRYRSRFWH